MSRLIESIRLLNGQFNNLSYHEERMNDTLKQVYGVEVNATLKDFFDSMDYPRKGLYKCRLLYDNESKLVEFLPYTFKPIKTLKLVEDDNILYYHKYSDRSALNQLMRRRDDFDDILIIRKGWVTDSSYANVVFKSGDRWYTPHSYLLKGTMRESLIKTGEIAEEQIKVTDIKKFQKFKLINAMLGFDGSECDISNIF